MDSEIARNTEEKYTRWVACWGNATSISDQKEAMYSRNVTFRYPVRMCFSGAALRFHFSNLTGTEPIVIEQAWVSDSNGDKKIIADSNTPVTVGGRTTFEGILCLW